jgi:hypothetical protein
MCVDQVKSIVLILEGLSLLNIVIEYQTEGHNLYVCNIDGHHWIQYIDKIMLYLTENMVIY